MSPRIFLVLAPHPDDAEFYAGGTIARFVSEGAKAVIVIATDGRCGSFNHTSEQLIHLRAEEASRAARVLGAEPPILLGHPDMELDKLPPGFLREQFIRVIRQYQPDMVIAEDPFASNEIHPDHRAVAWAASDAIYFASLPLIHPEQLQDGLNPHFTPEKYFYSESPSNTNKVVDITSTLQIKLDALAEHKTQMIFLVDDVKRQAALAGLDMDAMSGTALDDPITAISWAMKEQSSRVGQSIGIEYGEAFRYVRFHPFIETLVDSAHLT
jgi:LmbE family N-acetylglucosaminyl deacetylase